ncbi:uncharacterized protein V2V93DRAFT_142234 [Kockiozyma suomiensis]|uniref:uncharacterized protein n=1 Tax=Kockiozyma suomiensis TaxID=1337062 RepID=UPI003343B801
MTSINISSTSLLSSDCDSKSDQQPANHHGLTTDEQHELLFNDKLLSSNSDPTMQISGQSFSQEATDSNYLYSSLICTTEANDRISSSKGDSRNATALYLYQDKRSLDQAHSSSFCIVNDIKLGAIVDPDSLLKPKQNPRKRKKPAPVKVATESNPFLTIIDSSSDSHIITKRQTQSHSHIPFPLVISSDSAVLESYYIPSSPPRH